MEKILITGANGFLGKNLLDQLIYSDFEIYALDKEIPKKTSSKIHWIKVDLFNKEKVSRTMEMIAPHYLIHLAWTIEPGMRLNSNAHEKWINISMDLFKSFAVNGGKRILVSGSCAEYKWGTQIYSENTTPTEPDNEYGIYKNILHQKLSALCNTNNTSYIWARIFFMYGKYENKKRLVPSVIYSALKGEAIKVSHGNQIYDYLYIEDVVLALIKLIESNYNGAVNVCSGNPIQLKNLVFKIAESMGQNHLVKLGEVETKTNEPQFIVGSNNLLKEITNWQQTTGLDEGIKQTINYVTNETHNDR